MLERTKAQSPFYTADHDAFREVMRRFVAREIEPYAHEWDEAGEFPRELYAKASEIGLLGLGFPEEYGGTTVDQFMKIVVSQELARARRRRDQREPDEPHHRFATDRCVPRGLRSRRGCCPRCCRQENLGARDHRAERRIRRRQSAHQGAPRWRSLRRLWREDVYHLGMRADYLTVAVRTGGEGAGGVSLLLIEGDTPGLSRTKLKKMGWWASDTATLLSTNAACRSKT